VAELNIRNITAAQVLAVLKRRLDNPSPSFSWLDVQQEMHNQMFTVAKTAGYDVLDDISAAIDQAIARGETFDTFQKQLEPILREKGWWGRGPALDPTTGELVDAQLGSPRRLGIIYDTNMRVSYAAGNWVDIQNNKTDFPYLMYDAVHDSKTRPEHRIWGGVDDGKPVVLPCDHAWWDTHMPPNGWRCRCGVIAITQAQYDTMAAAGAMKGEPFSIMRLFRNARTGETTQVPDGIDPGFAYNPGKAFLAAMGAGA